jgi:hypothetical protein
MISYHITSAITVTEVSEPNSQIIIDEPIWHMALRVVKSFKVTRTDNRVTTIGFLRRCYPEMDVHTARIVVDAAIYAIDNATYTCRRCGDLRD